MGVWTDPFGVGSGYSAATELVGPVYNIKDYGAVGDGVADDTNAIKSAFAAVPSAGGTVLVPVGTYKITSTIDIPSNCLVQGTWGGLISFNTTLKNGSLFIWAGATNGIAVRILGRQFVCIDGLSISGGGIDGVTGLLVDSVNTPATRNFSLRNFSIFNCGTPGTPTGVGLQLGTSEVTDYQNDAGLIEKFEISNCGYGIKVQSGNALSISSIRDGSIISCNRGMYLQDCGPITLENLAFGGATPGPDPAYIWSSMQNTLMLTNVQGEGGTGNLLTVDTTSADLNHTITLIGCTVNRPIDIRVLRRIVSIGNIYTDVLKLTANSTQVLSLLDGFSGAGAISRIGTSSNVVTLSPGTSAPTLDLTSNVEGPILRLSTAGPSANPGLSIKNNGTSGREWQLLAHDSAGLLAGGFTLRDNTAASNPLQVDPSPLDGQLRLSTNGVRVKRLLGILGNAPTIAAGGPNGATPPAPTITGTDTRGTVSFGSGTAPTTGIQVTVNYNVVLATNTYVSITPLNAATAALQPYIAAQNGNFFQIGFGVAPAASQAAGTYQLSYQSLG